MIDNKKLGLARFTDYQHQEQIRGDINVCFEDLYDALGAVRDDGRELEAVLTRILFGERAGNENGDWRPLKERLTL